MDKITFEKIVILRNALEKDERVLELEKNNKLIESDDEVIKLTKLFKEKEEAYNFALEHYGENSSKTNEIKKELSNAKFALESNPLVKQYNESYNKVRDLYSKIDHILFDDLKENNLCRYCHD